MTTATDKQQRVIFQCKNKECKHTWAYDYTVYEKWVGPRKAIYLYRETIGVTGYKKLVSDAVDGMRYPACGVFKVTARDVKGSYSENHVCGGSCVNAKGPICECSCCGKNHGSAWLGH